MHSHLHTQDNKGRSDPAGRLVKKSVLLTPVATCQFISLLCARLAQFFRSFADLTLLNLVCRTWFADRFADLLSLSGCEEIMNALEECHAKGFLWKMFGGCNSIKAEVNKCLSQERTKKSRKNRETGLERRRRIEAIWEQMDNGDYSALEKYNKR